MKNKTVIAIFDPDDNNRTLIKQSIKNIVDGDIVFIEASNGIKAVEVIEKRINFCFINLMLPLLDANIVAELLAEKNEGTKIIALNSLSFNKESYANDKIVEKYPFFDYSLELPFSIFSLKESLNN